MKTLKQHLQEVYKEEFGKAKEDLVKAVSNQDYPYFKKAAIRWLQEHQQTHPNSVWAAIIEELIEELEQ